MESGISITQLQHEAHIWLVDPESIRDSDVLADFRTILSDEERHQCDRFHFPEDSHRYLVSHAMVRRVLSGYAGLAAVELRFSRSEQGRPEIANPEIEDIRFNLTHTRGLAACIVTRHLDCGIDAEMLDARHQMTAIAQRMYSTAEQHQLAALQGPALVEAFYSRWVLREAFVKAKGIGMSYPTHRLCFDILDGSTVEARFDESLQEDSDHWQFRLLQPTENHLAAVALRKDGASELAIIEHRFLP